MKKNVLALLSVIFVIVCFSCGDDEVNPPGPTTNLVTIHDNFFDPPNIIVSIGRPVFWRNEGTTVHTVTSGTPTSNPGKIFESGNLNPANGFQMVFSSPGNYPYFCRIHGASMSGTVTAR